MKKILHVRLKRNMHIFMGACKDTVQIDVTKGVQPFESQQNLPSRFLCGDKEFLMIDPVGLLNPKLFLLRFPIYIAADYACISQGTVNFLRNSSIQPALRNKRGRKNKINGGAVRHMCYFPFSV